MTPSGHSQVVMPFDWNDSGMTVDTNGSQDSSAAQAVLDSIKFTPSPEARFRTGGQLDFKLAAFLSLTVFALA